MPRLRLTPIVAALAVTATCALAQDGAPSFDCARASTAVESQICDSPDLAWYDRQMAASYGLARAASDASEAAALKDSQSNFLKRRNRCAGDRAYDCILNAYAGRLDELSAWAETDGFTTGTYRGPTGLLALVTYPSGKAAISLSTIGGGDHTCTFETDSARATPAGGAYFNEKPDPSYQQACSLTATPDGSAMTVATEGDGCTWYCGMRATLDGEFSRSGN